MKNAEYLSKQGIELDDLKNNRTYDVIGSTTALQRILKWLDEEYVGNGDDVLTTEEKEYLSVVIKPFRDRIRSISKEQLYDDNVEHLWFAFNDDSEDEFCLPSFKAGTAYRGMVLYHYYTLKDLGL